MPELPEVENVVRGLQPLLADQPSVSRVVLRRRDLRVPFTAGLAKKLGREKILSVQRRAKFILFETEVYWLINHLGMTGSWREEKESQKHDHCTLEFDSGLKLAFNDPRRFGLLILEHKDRLEKNKWLKQLGVEPFDPSFTGAWFYERIRRRKSPLKNVLMDQHLVVGVGNIYASEALFLAGISPKKSAHRTTLAECERAVGAIQAVLKAAIEQGGSTIRSYTNAQGVSGNFQERLRVYERAGEPCTVCGESIRATVLSGRTTYWCSQCQK